MSPKAPPLLLALVLALLPPAAAAAPKSDPWPRWEAHDPAAAATIDHAAWTGFLQSFRQLGDNGVARIDYGAVDAAARDGLQRYIDRLAAVAIDEYDRDQQRPFWINLYNALTVGVILDHYPVDSIRGIDISPGLFSDGPWGRKLVTVDGVDLSLDDIEHRILRPIWNDPRVHYAVNCAALGCPNLQPVAFTANNTDELLDRGARAFVNHPRGAAVEDGELRVSSIYEWFQADFGGTESGVVAHLRQYAEPGLRTRLQGRRGYADHDYDWTLNDVR